MILFTDCDFAIDDPPLGPMSSTDESELADSISLLSMTKLNQSPLGLPTYEEAWLLAQDVISNSSETSQVSQCGTSTASVGQTSPHVQCDNMMTPGPPVGNPALYPSPNNSQMGQGLQAPPYVSPTISPNSLPTPDPSPLGQREAGQARVNISWRDNGPMQLSPQYAQPAEQSQFSAPLQPGRPTADAALSSKSALLATMKKKGAKEFSACQSTPHGHGANMQRIWGPQSNYPYQYQDNSENNRSGMNSSMQQSYNWNMAPNQDPNLNQTLNHNPVMSGQYMPRTVNENIPTNPMHVEEGGYPNRWEMHPAQTNSIPPPFEDTLPQLNVDSNSQSVKRQQGQGINMQYPDSRYGWEQPPNVISPPFQGDAKLPFGFPGNGIHKTPTTLQEW